MSHNIIDAILIFVVYVLLSHVTLTQLKKSAKYWALGILNVMASLYFYYVSGVTESSQLSLHTILGGTYIAAVSVFFVLMKLATQNKVAWKWVFLAPLLFLINVKYLPGQWNALNQLFLSVDASYVTHIHSIAWVGISFMTFRLCRLFMTVRNGQEETPSYPLFMGYAFFLPIFLVGPITSYKKFAEDLKTRNQPEFVSAMLFIVLGALKFIVLANLFKQLTYKQLILDGYMHPLIDLFIAAPCYYFFLYCNFSGICDIATGVAGLLGIRIDQNFNNPFASRNVKDFWNRWHITLSEFVRDAAFTPLTKIIVHKFGANVTNHAIAAMVFFVFLLIGVWHGVGYHFLIFGFVHALGVTINHYYTIFLKDKLGRKKLKAYNAHRGIRLLAQAFTFVYISFSFFFFANHLGDIKAVLAAVGLF